MADEINNSQIGKNFNTVFGKLEQKHSKGLNVFGVLAPIGTIVGSTALELSLANGLSKDIKEKASLHYMRGKAIQKQAKAHFDSIDAQEV